MQVLDEMQQEGVQFNMGTHAAIVGSMIVKRDAKGAIAYVLKLKADGLKCALANITHLCLLADW